MQTLARQPRREVSTFFRRQISHQHAIGAGPLCFDAQLLDSKLQQRIEIAEKNDGDIGLPARLRQHFQSLGHARAIFESAHGCSLNDRTVGDRIAKRNAQLNDVRARVGKFDQELDCGAKVGIARDNKRDQRVLTLLPQACESFRDAVHSPPSSIPCNRRHVFVSSA